MTDPIDKFPPIKKQAFVALARGPLRLVPDVGWRSDITYEVFNSHTVQWLASCGWALFGPERTTVQISSEGLRLITEKAMP